MASDLAKQDRLTHEQARNIAMANRPTSDDTLQSLSSPIGHFVLGQDSVDLLRSSTEKPVATIKRSEPIILLARETFDGGAWVRVCNSSGKQGYVPADTVLCTKRFMIERLIFVLVAAIALSPLAKLKEGLSPIGVAAYLLVAISAIYIFGKLWFGVGGFFEEVSVSDPKISFDWRRLAKEPVRFIGVLILISFFVGLIAALRACAK